LAPKTSKPGYGPELHNIQRQAETDRMLSIEVNQTTNGENTMLLQNQGCNFYI